MDSVDEWLVRFENDVDMQVAEAQRKAEAAANMADEMTRVVGRAQAERGEIAVTTDVAGRVTGLKLTAAAVRHHPDALAGKLLETINRARRDAGRQALDLAADTFGEDSSTYARIAEELGLARQEGEVQ